MDRDIPSVLTTLAGVASLTDLLAEMPLPTPLPQVLSNKSLLFHPRVAEEALKLLGVRDDKLVPQLVHSLVQTSADHIELKDHYASADINIDQQDTLPELLRAILEKNPDVFNGTDVNSPRPMHWNHAGPHVYGAGHVSPGTRHTPQGSPASPASARFPPPAPIVNQSSNRPSVITEQHKNASMQQQQQQSSTIPQQQPQPQQQLQPAQLMQHPMYQQPQQQQQQQQVQQNIPQQQVQLQPDKKSGRKRKTKQAPLNETPALNSAAGQQGFQSYAGLKNSVPAEPSAISLKTASVVPGSAFNFGPGPNALGLSTGLYGDKDSYTGFLDEYRAAPTNYYMHRSTPEASADKSQPRSAHQQTPSAPTASFPFLGHPQPRAPGYASLAAPFMGAHAHAHQGPHAPLMDPNSQIYQQYLLHQGLLGPPAGYPPGYHPALSMRQPYDSMTRPSWL